ncbi:MAG: PAS domain S-box protein [bacterium]|nr:PAS domain S-box protein [bacterium]
MSAIAVNFTLHLLVLSGDAGVWLDLLFSDDQAEHWSLEGMLFARNRSVFALGLIQLSVDLATGALTLGLLARFWMDRKQLARGLAGSESRNRSIFEAAVDAIIIIDSRGKIEAVNPATETLFGYRASEMLNRNISMLMPDPYHSEHDRYLQNYLRTGQKKIIGVGREALGVRKDGSEFPAYLSVSEVYDQGERYFTGILHDITNLKEAELKLSVERNFISAVLETAGAAVVVLDRNGRIVNFNRESQEISGYSFDEVYGRVIWDFLVPEEDIEATRKQFNALMMGRFPNHHENAWLTKSGRERLLQWSNTALEGEVVDGRVEFVVGIGIDITDKRRSEKDLSVLSRKIIEIQEDERNRIASEVHDVLGQSLIALKFMVDDVVYRLREEDTEARDKLGEINEYINEAVRQARSISHNLSPIALKKIGLSHAIRELVNSFQAGTNYKIKLDLEAMDAFFRSRWEINIYRIIQESLTNIFKHAGATEIEIQARQIGNALVLKVKDNGVGFELQDQVQADLEFEQAESGGNGELDERGIGQLIMQERAALLGGHLKILSKKNQGTEIVLEIPE